MPFVQSRKKHLSWPHRRRQEASTTTRGSTRHDEPRVESVIGPALPEEAHVNLVLDLALRVGEVLMASGAGAADVTATAIAVTSAFGLPRCEVDVIFSSISVCCQRGSDLAPITAQRVVRSRGLDYTRLTAADQLVQKITSGQITAAEASTELVKITNAARPYPRWVATVASALLASSVAVLLGGGMLVALVAGAITALLDRVGRTLNKRSLPFFFQQLVGGAVATGSTLTLMWCGLLPSDAHPSLIVAAAITALLSGLSVVGAVQDAITGYNVTAAGRTMEVTVMSAGLVAGVVLALSVAKQFGLPNNIPVADPLTQTALRLPVGTLAGAAAAAAFALACYATPRALVVAAAAGALGAITHGALVLLNVNEITASALAAILIGFSGGVVSRRLHVPPLVVAVSGLTPLLPGLTVYRSVFQLAVLRSPVGVGTLSTAVAIALALAAGVVLGEFLAQPARTGLGRLERRLAGPRLIGPLRPAQRRLD